MPVPMHLCLAPYANALVIKWCKKCSIYDYHLAVQSLVAGYQIYP